jgi:hypothetical protein
VGDEGEEVSAITAMVDGDDLDVTREGASVTLARPLIKVAAFSYGLRWALGDEPHSGSAMPCAKSLGGRK